MEREHKKNKPLTVLLTNDDGIYAPGLYALYHELKADHQVCVVAPETEMSAVGHAITLSLPIRVRSIKRDGSFYGHAVTGTPADCVKIAVQELLDLPPDVILSGINQGSNVGVNILYSGTVSAATEGAFMGVPSAAISLDTRTNPDFRFAARFSREIIRFMMENPMCDGTALNVNVPAVPAREIKGVSLVRQGLSMFDERYERRSDPRGNVYYWLAGEKIIENGGTDCDSAVLKEKKITITPIHYDLTCLPELERLNAAAPSFSLEPNDETPSSIRKGPGK